MGKQRRLTECVTAISVAIVALWMLAACSVEETVSHPSCQSGGSWVIVTQSVPSASQVPCLDPLPHGWEIGTVRINQEGTVVALNSDRAGTSAARLHFTASCGIGEAVATQSEHRDTERFDEVLRLTPGFLANRYYRFAGGCVWWEFDFDEAAPSALLVELGNTLKLMQRSDLQVQFSDDFLDEEL